MRRLKCSSVSTVKKKNPWKISLSLTWTCQVGRCHGDYFFLFVFLASTSSPFYCSHGTERSWYRLLPNLASWKHLIGFISFLGVLNVQKTLFTLRWKPGDLLFASRFLPFLFPLYLALTLFPLLFLFAWATLIICLSPVVLEPWPISLPPLPFVCLNQELINGGRMKRHFLNWIWCEPCRCVTSILDPAAWPHCVFCFNLSL